MAADPYQRFAIMPLGAGAAPAEALAVGSLDDMMMHALPQTQALEQGRRQLADAQARHALRVMADSAELGEREQEAAATKAQADAVMADAVARFVIDVAALGRRLDSLVAAG